MEDITYNVRVYRTEKRTNAAGKVTSYRVTWKVGGQLFRESFRKEAQADSFRSDLRAAANKAKAFSAQTGRPVDGPTVNG